MDLTTTLQRRAVLPLRAGAEGDRLLGVDVARGIALLGMAVTHVFAANDADGRTALSHLVFSGRSSALFAVLAGVSLALLTGRATPLRGEDRARASLALVVRAVLLGALGVVLVGTGADIAIILTYYGLLFLCGLPFLGLRARALAAWAVGATLLLPLLSYALRSAFDLEPTFEQPSFERLDMPRQVLEELLLTGYYPVVPWLAYLLTGLAVGRLDLRSRDVATRLLACGAGLAVVARVVSAYATELGRDQLLPVVDGALDIGLHDAVRDGSFGVVETQTPWLLVTDGPHTGTPLDLAATIGSALAVLGLCLLLLHLGAAVRTALLPLAAVGAMTLTLYSLHVWAVSRWDGEDAGAFYATQLVVALVGALLWRTLVGRGPLEALLAALTRLVRTAGR